MKEVISGYSVDSRGLRAEEATHPVWGTKGIWRPLDIFQGHLVAQVYYPDRRIREIKKSNS